MNRKDVVARLKTVEPVLREHGVGALYLFGSYGRDEATRDSDIDVIVEADRDDFYALSNYMGAYAVLSDMFAGTAVSYATWEGVSKFIRSSVESEAVRVF